VKYKLAGSATNSWLMNFVVTEIIVDVNIVTNITRIEDPMILIFLIQTIFFTSSQFVITAAIIAFIDVVVINAYSVSAV
jgi:hypothetical protein